MTWLTEDQVEALRELSRFWPEAGLSLIGASALGCLMPDFRRHTWPWREARLTGEGRGS